MPSSPLRPLSQKVSRWVLQQEDHPQQEGFYEAEGEVRAHERQHPWWKVMCLTGVDYFSTLGYQPGIAALAAGAVSPFATLVLVLVTLFGALPMYRRVAEDSPHGDGSISMLERLLSYWPSKFLVLSLIGFVATGFIITITLSAADASAHLIENPFLKSALEGHQVGVTLLLLLLLGAVFLKGFKEAIGIAVVLVVAYLALSAVVIGKGAQVILAQPDLVQNWLGSLHAGFGSPLALIGAALLVFPKLALGLSGFETGVVVMPLIEGDKGDTEEKPTGRIRNGKRLLTTAALLMSAFLITSSLVTTLLIPAAQFQPGGEANGRALAFLAHTYLGEWFGTAYDVSTILILWFAGASAMAGLLNIVPRYLPRYGMAPEWTRLHRPLVLIYLLIAFVVTVAFRANVDAQAAAYATGVLAMMTSAAVAVCLTAIRRRQPGVARAFGVISAIFVYTSAVTIFSNPQGLLIALLFIVLILAVGISSRISRSFELRVSQVQFDDAAIQVLKTHPIRPLRFVCHHPGRSAESEYSKQELRVRQMVHLPEDEPFLFLEVEVDDASEFTDVVEVTGLNVGPYSILRARGSSIPNTIAAVMLTLRKKGAPPQVYMRWTEESPLQLALDFVIGGRGDVPPLTREILRRAEPDRDRRPIVHVGG
ncbi:APC family permease [Deinococcus radiotolerans]|uniref:Amino acid transporter n=1 Tax=Deinococcus radiotolerans TaxID=1309407 RepID=A0ABQ2FKA1_9DEIO|nr:amino acid transporter [Deinococcus radiotolerans]GGL03787.1 amino acid transporter [Deinococcus radiotolerans]